MAQYELIRDTRGCVIRLHGEVDGRILTEANNALYALDTDQQFRWQLWDMRDVNVLDISPDQLRQLAIADHHATTANPHQRVAIVGSRELLGSSDRLYGIYATVWTEFETESFDSFAEARAWAGGGNDR